VTRGTVKWFDDEKGYGFIRPEDGGAEVFVHFSAIERVGNERRTLVENEVVEFETGPNPKNPKRISATTVRKLDGADAQGTAG
jgi:CspA family cold shock protein